MEKYYKVFLGGVPVRVDKDAIAAHFAAYGTVLSCRLKKNQQTGRSLGYAYLTVKEKEAYERLLAETVVFQGRVIDIKPLWKKKELGDKLEEEKRKKIFVSNLPHDLTNAELTAYFSKFGHVANAFVIKDPDTLRNRNYGYVIFKEHGDYSKVLDYPGEHYVKGHAKIKVKMCLKQDELHQLKATKNKNRKVRKTTTGKASKEQTNELFFNADNTNKLLNEENKGSYTYTSRIFDEGLNERSCGNSHDIHESSPSPRICLVEQPNQLHHSARPDLIHFPRAGDQTDAFRPSEFSVDPSHVKTHGCKGQSITQVPLSASGNPARVLPGCLKSQEARLLMSRDAKPKISSCRLNECEENYRYNGVTVWKPYALRK